MTLSVGNYTVLNALLWGNFSGHCLKAEGESSWKLRVVHIAIAAIELLPVISQIVSLVELILAKLVDVMKHFFWRVVVMIKEIKEITPKINSEADINLIKFFNSFATQLVRWPFWGLPILKGSETEQAKTIRVWMKYNFDVLQEQTKLYLGGLGLTQLPLEIKLFNNLKKLSLSRNRISSLEGVIFPTSLQQIDLRFNSLERLPDSINVLLKCIIDLDYNPIDSSYILELREIRQKEIKERKGPWFRWPESLAYSSKFKIVNR